MMKMAADRSQEVPSLSQTVPGSVHTGPSLEQETVVGPAPPINVRRAVRSNRKFARRIRWDAYMAPIGRLFRIRRLEPDASALAQAVAQWQFNNGLSVDGVIGPSTWEAMLSVLPLSYRGPAHSLIVNGQMLPRPGRLRVRNMNAPDVADFTGRRRRDRISEIIVHESVTRSVQTTERVLKRRGLGVHLMVDAYGNVTQHADLASRRLAHASPRNQRSVGLEVVNPYYPKYLRKKSPWSGDPIQAQWADKGRYVLPTLPQAEATAHLLFWLTSPAAKGLDIPRQWVGIEGNRLAMSRVPGAKESTRPGIYAHTYFKHADGAWPVLYAFLRIEAQLSPRAAYHRSIYLATTGATSVPLF